MSSPSITPPLLVLAVDDEVENNEALKRAFRKRTDLVLHCATSSEEAFQLVKATPFQLLLIDYSMGATTGVDFIERARTILPNSVMIMVTAYPELKRVIEAQTRGLLDGILAKPWTPEELNATIVHASSMIRIRAVRDSMLRAQKPKP